MAISELNASCEILTNSLRIAIRRTAYRRRLLCQRVQPETGGTRLLFINETVNEGARSHFGAAGSPWQGPRILYQSSRYTQARFAPNLAKKTP